MKVENEFDVFCDEYYDMISEICVNTGMNQEMDFNMDHVIDLCYDAFLEGRFDKKSSVLEFPWK